MKTCKKVHRFPGFSSGVTCLEPAPALDVVAVGTEEGSIHVHNFKFDETVVTFKQDWGSVAQLSFRSDGPPMLVSASPAGHIAVWDLEVSK